MARRSVEGATTMWVPQVREANLGCRYDRKTQMSRKWRGASGAPDHRGLTRYSSCYKKMSLDEAEYEGSGN
jgi:hypothetical protein